MKQFFFAFFQLTMYPNQVREVKNKLKCWITDDDGNDVETGMHNKCPLQLQSIKLTTRYISSHPNFVNLTVASISIRGSVIVPTLLGIKDSVHLKDCYLQYPYQGEFVIKNASALPVMFCVVQKVSKCKVMTLKSCLAHLNL